MNSTIIYIPFIQKCPICGGDVTYITDSITKVERAWCLNENCNGKSLNRIEHFFGKKGLNIKGISKATIEKLMDWGWVEDVPDIFTLASHRSDWIKKTGFGEKSVDNILSAIENGKEVTLTQLLSAVGIPKVGLSIAQKISDYCNGDFDVFLNAAQNNKFLQVNGIGEEISHNLKVYDYEWIVDMLKTGKCFLKPSEVNETSLPVGEELRGETIVITGKLKMFKKRTELETLIKLHGGNVGSVVNGKTTMLINNDKDSNTKKNQEAIARNIPILTEQDFMDTLLPNAL